MFFWRKCQRAFMQYSTLMKQRSMKWWHLTSQLRHTCLLFPKATQMLRHKQKTLSTCLWRLDMKLKPKSTFIHQRKCDFTLVCLHMTYSWLCLSMWLHMCLVVDTFQEFVMVLIKLQLNVPFQDLAYCLDISLSSVSRIFNSWIAVRLSCFIDWPDRKELVLPVDIWP